MSDFVMFPANASDLVFAAVVLVLVVYVARLPNKSPASKLAFGILMWGFLMLLWLPFRDMYFNSGWESRWMNLAAGLFGDSPLVIPLAVLAFAYLLGPQRFKREQRWALGTAGIIVVGGKIAFVLGWNLPILLIVYILGSLALATSVLIRKWRRAPGVEEFGAFNRSGYAGFAGFLLLSVLIMPISATLTALGSPGALEVVQESFVVVSWVVVGLLFLQYAPEPSSLEAKFVGAACLAVLIMSKAFTAPINRPGERLPLYMPAPEPETMAYLPTAEGGYRLEGRPASFREPRGDTLAVQDNGTIAVSSDFPLTVFGASFDSLHVWADGMVSFARRPDSLSGYRRADFYESEGPILAVLGYNMSPSKGGAVLVDRSPDSLVVTWDRVPSSDQNLGPPNSREMSAQLVIHRDGILTASIGSMAFRPWVWRQGISPGRTSAGQDFPDPADWGGDGHYGDLVASHFPLVAAADRPLFREERNRSQYEMWSTATSISILRNGLGTLALVLLLIPLFFRSSVRNRLRRLREGLVRVDGGDLGVEVPVTVNDEVGQLSTSFNRMTAALRRYSNEMEELVDERTAELRATQAQLVEQEKLASLGSLTAGIAHEIKNPLNFVNNFAEVNAELADELTEAIAEGDVAEATALLADLRDNATQIAKHGKRADSIVRAMMQHARGGGSEKETIDVNVFLEEYAGLAWHGVRARDEDFRAELVRDFDPDAGSLDVLPQELGRVVLNLLNNAFDATRETEGAQVVIGSRHTNEGVEITVSDNGPGIPPEIRQKIFEPFFTTKATGEGTGLGLSLSYDIVTKGHGGTMLVRTSIEGGAEFLISLPA